MFTHKPLLVSELHRQEILSFWAMVTRLCPSYCYWKQLANSVTQMPQSPLIQHSPGSINRSSMPPFQPSHFQGYQQSPLQQALTPPSGNGPYPSVEDPSSFRDPRADRQGELSLSDSSPSQGSDVKIYCAACQGVSRLKESYACTECICGLCQQCVDVLMAEQGARRRCPRCATVGGKFRPFQVEVR